MARVKFNTKSLDRDTGETYPASDKFVDVPDAFAARIKALQSSNPAHEHSFEFQVQEKAQEKKPAKKGK